MKLLQSIWNWLLALMFPIASDVKNGKIDTKARCDCDGHVSPPIPTPSIPPKKEVIVETPKETEQPKVEPMTPQTPTIKAAKSKPSKPKKSIDSQIAEAAKASVKAPKKAVKKKK